MKIYPVILSGGSGSRLWPLSRAAMPKQLLPLISDMTMLQETLLRLVDLPNVMPPLFVCGNEHRFMIAEQMRQVDIAPLAILLEPEGRNTAPAVAAAANYLLSIDPDAVMLVLPADHVITDISAFHAAITQAVISAAAGTLTTFGIVPTSAQTGYGYIRTGAAIASMEGCYAIEKFIEKPDLATATSYLKDGNYLWNSGMFAFLAKTYLSELKKFRPEMAALAAASVKNEFRDLDFCRLDDAAFRACASESIDYAVMEPTSCATVVPANIGWSDVGSWSSLADVLPVDHNGNVVRGDVYLEDVKNTLVRAESRMVAVIGVADVVIVETRDAVLIVHKDKVQNVRNVVNYLQTNRRTEHVNHTKVYRPWGRYEGIDTGERFQVKRITVNPGEKLSLQMHHHRAEHWVVVRGTAKITCGEQVKLLTENESTYIPIGMTHRLENPGKVPLHLIEIQSGSYLGEDDIVRFDDIYRRDIEKQH